MRKMIRTIINYLILLSAVTALAFVVQMLVYRSLLINWVDSGLIRDYGFNYTLTVLFGVLFILISTRKPDQLGNAYLGSVSVKFILFFIIIYPSVTLDGAVNKIEFSNFFIPFSVCLLTELLFLIRLLRN